MILCEKQAEPLSNPSPISIEEEQRAYKTWQHLADLEEGFFKQKSKLQWLNVGDRDNFYFHKTAQVRRMRNSIREIEGPTGETLETSTEIMIEAERFFK